MAEIVGLSSGVLALAASALKSSAKLYETIKDIRSHPHQVRELLTELASLNLVLRKLSETGDLQLDVDLTALTLTLTQCRQSCDEVEAQLLDSCSRSSPDRTSFRDWAKLKFNGSDAHLDHIQQKLDTLTHRAAAGPILDVTTRQHMEEEEKSTKKGLEFCATLLQAIEQTEVEFFESDSSSASAQAQVSTSQMLFDGKTINGKNRAVGKRLKQAGGHFGEDSLQQVSQDFKAVSIHYADLQEHTPERSAMEPGTHAATAGTDSTFGHRHGPGVTLAKQHMPGAAGTGQTGG
ncbi:hypothetical protein HYQ46_003107 [Verticillium longisporum]|uniref:Azaphilone pigments biosynthesis cluster protein L N-terminal domain-containing protein n=1 Tax=Verticillium alfalfae (strain VaMs.102 / ATCC MYA-4576 / FGSC 10136) TaxID=526221 RepID=C9SZ28_VERA1|nr:conserved hypothetical protein [Verticillium alfalfae VaMs.102]EEY24043.1 conserved hypothetical protein [Verticillium alfalfae VaMs.102]KAG7110483.1 hypothetical protein HYQ44_010873 [Verticillium longisporum]KAG7148023.1 hypothetical protein HYQ46_003107 [Verticillium longisporum]